MPKKTIKVEHTYDTSTGEIFNTAKSISIKSSYLSFISINTINNAKWIDKCKSIKHLKIALYIASNYDRNKNGYSLSINKYHVSNLSKIIQVSDRTIYRYIRDLQQQNIIKYIDNTYYANPEYFIKSSNSKYINLITQFYEDGNKQQNNNE